MGFLWKLWRQPIPRADVPSLRHVRVWSLFKHTQAWLPLSAPSHQLETFSHFLIQTRKTCILNLNLYLHVALWLKAERRIYIYIDMYQHSRGTEKNAGSGSLHSQGERSAAATFRNRKSQWNARSLSRLVKEALRTQRLQCFTSFWDDWVWNKIQLHCPAWARLG